MFGLVEMVISTNPKPMISRNLYENIRIAQTTASCWLLYLLTEVAHVYGDDLD